MIYGVTIGGKNTLTEWGLMLCDDLSIGAASPRYKFVSVPEMSGALDMTESLTGQVTYDQRKISYTLYAAHDIIAGTRTPATEEHFQTVLSRFNTFANGKRLAVYLPDDPNHYFMGRVSISGKSGFNSGRVKVEVIADPYRYKSSETSVSVTSSGTKTLQNEGMPAVPTFTASAAGTTITFGSVSHTLVSGVNRFPDIVLQPGNNSITVSNLSGTLTIKYQEGVL